MSKQAMSKDWKSYLQSIPILTKEQYEELANSATPRTDAAYKDSTVRGIYELFNESQNLELELNAAQAAIRQQQLLEEENMRLKERVKRMEEAGDRLAMFTHPSSDRAAAWAKAKEAA